MGIMTTFKYWFRGSDGRHATPASARNTRVAVPEALEPRRLFSGGELDSSFGVGGEAFNLEISRTNDVVIQSDGKIVAIGTAYGNYFDFGVTRYNEDGSADATFGVNGVAVTDFANDADIAHDLLMQPDGKLVVAGYATVGGEARFAVARYRHDGSLDPAFGMAGRVVLDVGGRGGHDVGHGVVVQPDGKLVVVGYTGDEALDFALVRLNGDGSLDESFGSGGTLTTDFGGGYDGGVSVALGADGRIVAAGGHAAPGTFFPRSAAIAVYLPDGNLDESFGSGGRVTTSVSGRDTYAGDVAVQPDGKIVAVGSALFRYLPNGVLDASFGSGGVVQDVVRDCHRLVLRPDGTILVDENGMYASQLRSDGTLDPSFGNGGRSEPSLTPGGSGGIAVQRDGKVVVAGSVAGYSYQMIIRYTASQAPTDLQVFSTTGTFGGSATLTATVTSLGSPVAGAVVTFELFGNAVGTATSDANGTATLPDVTLIGIDGGSYAGAVTATFGGDSGHLGSSGSATLLVQRAVPTFVNVAPVVAILHQEMTQFSGRVSYANELGTFVPTGLVSLTLDGTIVAVAIHPATGSFTAELPTETLPVGTHSVTLEYSGDRNFAPLSVGTSIAVSYEHALLFDADRAVRGGSVLPVHLSLIDADGKNVSSSAVVVTAVGIATSASAPPSTSMPPVSAGSSNADGIFRYEATLGDGGGYSFNLTTATLSSGTYYFFFQVADDPVLHSFQFTVR